jgi:hypothetical protein
VARPPTEVEIAPGEPTWRDEHLTGCTASASWGGRGCESALVFAWLVRVSAGQHQGVDILPTVKSLEEALKYSPNTRSSRQRCSRWSQTERGGYVNASFY